MRLFAPRPSRERDDERCVRSLGDGTRGHNKKLSSDENGARHWAEAGRARVPDGASEDDNVVVSEWGCEDLPATAAWRH